MGEHVWIGKTKIESYNPKICVPVMEDNIQDVIQTVKELVEKSEQNSKEYATDLIEVRADGFYQGQTTAELVELLKQIKIAAKSTPLLFTLRTQSQGGKAVVSREEYETILLQVAESNTMDAVDVEAFVFEGVNQKFIKRLKKHGAVVLLSRHVMNNTPKEEELKDMIHKMKELQADIIKIAVMPQNEEEVNAFMKFVTENIKREKILLCGISMGELGKISRINGKITGSCITFASYHQPSAKGQFTLRQMHKIMEEKDGKENRECFY